MSLSSSQGQNDATLTEEEATALAISDRAALVFGKATTPTLLPGEVIIASAEFVEGHNTCSLESGVSGSLFVTNYKLSFVATEGSSYSKPVTIAHDAQTFEENDIPLTCIFRIHKIIGNKRSRLTSRLSENAQISGLEIRCKDWRQFKFLFLSNAKRDQPYRLVNTLLHYAFPTSSSRLFAFDFKSDGDLLLAANALSKSLVAKDSHPAAAGTAILRDKVQLLHEELLQLCHTKSIVPESSTGAAEATVAVVAATATSTATEAQSSTNRIAGKKPKRSQSAVSGGSGSYRIKDSTVDEGSSPDDTSGTSGTGRRKVFDSFLNKIKGKSRSKSVANLDDSLDEDQEMSPVSSKSLENNRMSYFSATARSAALSAAKENMEMSKEAESNDADTESSGRYQSSPDISTTPDQLPMSSSDNTTASGGEKRGKNIIAAQGPILNSLLLPSLERLYFDLLWEMKRMTVDPQLWRISKANLSYKLSESYPAFMVVPNSISDAQLWSVAPSFYYKRFPVWCWSDPLSMATLTRCSSPTPSSAPVLASASMASPSSPVSASGSGYFSGDSGSSASVNPSALATSSSDSDKTSSAQSAGDELHSFMSALMVASVCPHVTIDVTPHIPSVSHLRESFYRLQELCMGFTPKTFLQSDRNWFSTLEASKWPFYIQQVLHSANKIANKISNGKSVTVQVEDCRDGGSLVVSLAKLLLDPFYRTEKGFELLLQQEWVDMGHRFALRCGHVTRVPSMSNAGGSASRQGSSIGVGATFDGSGIASGGNSSGGSSSGSNTNGGGGTLASLSATAMSIWSSISSSVSSAADAPPSSGTTATSSNQEAKSNAAATLSEEAEVAYEAPYSALYDTEASEGGDNDLAPYFLLFMDCVHQLMTQYPLSFEMTDRYLVTLCDTLWSCLFGTFLADCERDRAESLVDHKTVPVWANMRLLMVNDTDFVYRNPAYVAPSESGDIDKEDVEMQGSHPSAGASANLTKARIQEGPSPVIPVSIRAHVQHLLSSNIFVGKHAPQVLSAELESYQVQFWHNNYLRWIPQIRPQGVHVDVCSPFLRVKELIQELHALADSIAQLSERVPLTSSL